MKNSSAVIYDRVETVGFTILDVGTPSQLRGTGHRPGFLQPFLQWTTTRLSPPRGEEVKPGT